jgi:hypothetical protein
MCHDPAILGRGGPVAKLPKIKDAPLAPAASQPMALAVMQPSPRFHNGKRE